MIKMTADETKKQGQREKQYLVFTQAARITKVPDSHEPLSIIGTHVGGGGEVPLLKKELGNNRYFLLDEGYFVGDVNNPEAGKYFPDDYRLNGVKFNFIRLLDHASITAEELSHLVDMNYEGVAQREKDILLLRPIHERRSNKYLCQMIQRHGL